MTIAQNFDRYRRTRQAGLVSPFTYYSKNLLVNGTFDSDVSSWSSVAPASIAYSSGTCRVTRNSAGIDTDMCYQDVAVIPGYSYILTFDFVYQNATSTYFSLLVSHDGGTTDLLIVDNIRYYVTYISRVVVATSSSIRVLVKPTNNSTGIVGFDNISMRCIYEPYSKL